VSLLNGHDDYKEGKMLMKFQLTANSLKVIALFMMFLDHYVVVFMTHNDIISFLLRVPGRIAAPIFCYFIAEGFHFTSNKKKYIKRLLILAVISHIPYNFLFNYSFFQATSIMWGLALGIIALSIIKSGNYHIVVKILALALACALSVTANWNYISVLWIVAFGIFSGNFKYQVLSFILVGLVFHLVPTYQNFGPTHYGYPHWYQIGIFLAIPLLAMYNGELGKKSKTINRLFYISYPGHMLLFYYIRHLLTV
jgi:hypothetical protein